MKEWELQREPLQIISSYTVNAYTALPRPPSGTVCGVDTGNEGGLADEGVCGVATGNGGGLVDEGVEATGREINENVCER